MATALSALPSPSSLEGLYQKSLLCVAMDLVALQVLGVHINASFPS